MNRSGNRGQGTEISLWDAQFEVFKTMTPPLRPHESEVAIMQGLVDTPAAGVPPERFEALLLGLTPEYVGLRWPTQGRVTVVDRSRHVVEEWWPGDIPGKREIVLADWLHMPFDSARFDLILGDGVFNFMPFPSGMQKLSSALSSLLTPGGRLGVRVFTQANPAESPDDLIEEFRRSESVDYFGFRFRLAQSIQQSPEQGLFLNKDTVDAYLVRRGVELQDLYRKSGHTPPDVEPIPDNAADRFRVHYPTDRQFEDLIGECFELGEKRCGDHPLAQRTPIYVAEPTTGCSCPSH